MKWPTPPLPQSPQAQHGEREQVSTSRKPGCPGQSGFLDLDDFLGSLQLWDLDGFSTTCTCGTCTTWTTGTSTTLVSARDMRYFNNFQDLVNHEYWMSELQLRTSIVSCTTCTMCTWLCNHNGHVDNLVQELYLRNRHGLLNRLHRGHLPQLHDWNVHHCVDELNFCAPQIGICLCMITWTHTTLSMNCT